MNKNIGLYLMALSFYLIIAVVFLSHASAATSGPLRVSSGNSRYFSDRNGNIVYLTGSHNWFTLQDGGIVGKPLSIFVDFNNYLNTLASQNCNFIRLWSYEGWETGGTIFSPTAYKLVSGSYSNPKYDLSQFDQSYFDRLRSRVIAAQARGIYVSIMLFQGWSIESKGYSPNAWLGHPFNANNNINGINGDANGDGEGLEVHSLQIPSITNLQEAYMRKVIDTVNDLDNVLYEVSNEDYGGTENIQWQYHVINFVKSYEASKPLQHPVGMTAIANSDSFLFNSAADWISPSGTNDYRNDPPVATGQKVILYDNDHIGGGIEVNKNWAWQLFARGINPILMDNLDGDATHEQVRLTMGQTLSYAQRMNLAAMTPSTTLCSTRFCLASANEYLVYQPTASQSFTVNLNAGTYNYEWFNPATGSVVQSGSVTASGNMSFTPPFSNDAVLYLKSASALSADGILLKEEIAPGYCHLKFAAIREDTLASDHPVLQNPSSGDIMDYYGPCDHDPLGKDEIQSQKDQATRQRSRPD